MNFGSWNDMSKIGSPMSLTHEQFREMMKPIICGICRRIFNPTDEEREEARLALKEIDESIFEWEVTTNYE